MTINLILFLFLQHYDDHVSKLVEEKQKVIEQLERGLFAASRTEVSILSYSLYQLIS